MPALTWLPLALLSAFFAALVTIFSKVGLEKIDSTLATTIRAGFMFAFLIGIALFTGKFSQLHTITQKPLLLIIAAGIAGALSWLFYFWALKIGTASQVAPIDRLSLVFIVGMAALFLGEKITLMSGLGTILIIIGGILVART